jgi:CheY-like chemotaxis protein
MLQSLSEEIRLCYRRAEHYAREAKTAPTEELRTSYLRYERSWLELARSYELQQRLTLFINENRKRKTMGLADMGHGSADRTAANPARMKLSGLSQTANEPIPLESGMIAVVDDDDCVRDGLSTLIESRGRRTAAFASGEGYLASDVKEYTACLILDVHLPGMSGPDLQAHLIADGYCIPIVFVTGRFDEQVRSRVLTAGAFGYLTKPCDDNALFNCIERALRQ